MAFPVACERAADATGVEALRMAHRQSWVAVGLMGVLVAAACRAGRGLGGRSRLYRAVVAGLEAHVATHVGAFLALHFEREDVAVALIDLLNLRDAGHVHQRPTGRRPAPFDEHVHRLLSSEP